MATLQLTPQTLTVRFGRLEKIAGLVRDVDVPLSAVREVDVVRDALPATSGLRAPGLALPGRRKIGTWRSRGERTLVCVRRGQPAVRVRLTGQRHDTLLIGAVDATAVAAALAPAR